MLSSSCIKFLTDTSSVFNCLKNHHLILGSLQKFAQIIFDWTFLDDFYFTAAHQFLLVIYYGSMMNIKLWVLLTIYYWETMLQVTLLFILYYILRGMFHFLEFEYIFSFSFCLVRGIWYEQFKRFKDFFSFLYVRFLAVCQIRVGLMDVLHTLIKQLQSELVLEDLLKQKVR